jgi:hypothetical protein
MDNNAAYENAKKRVEAKIGFFVHLVVYIAVNLLLIVINLSTSPGHFWFQWPLLGWGIGLVFHAVGVFAMAGGSKLKERLIAKEMEKEAAPKP